jgi:hypothetical protein
MITPFQIFSFLLYLASVVLAIYFSSLISEGGFEGFIEIAGVAGGLAWLLFGSRIWCLPIFFALGFGGTFYVGFKIYPHEVGFLAGLIAILPTAILTRSVTVHRRGLPVTMLVLLAYLMVHCAISCIVYGGGLNFGNIGTIGRAYLGGAWSMVFVIVFYYYGNSRSFITGLYLFELAYTLRAVIGIIAYFSPSALYLPGVNFVLPGQGTMGYYDLRTVGVGLTFLSLSLLFDQKKGPHKYIQIALLVLALISSAMGGGRLYLVIVLFALVVAAFYSRKWILVAAMPVAIAGLIIAVNLELIPLDELPEGAARSLSILVLKDRESVGKEMGTYGSDQWHERLREIAIERWTATPLTFLFGNGSRPFNASVFEESTSRAVETLLEEAANVNSYEAGLWQTVAMLGLVGFLLYTAVIGIFLYRVVIFAQRIPNDRWVKTILFYTCLVVFQWYAFCYGQGGLPSIEIFIVTLGSFYLQDRALELMGDPKNRNIALDIPLFNA